MSLFRLFNRYKRHPSIYRSQSETVFFFTFHKCASTLFSKLILKHALDLYHIDYAAQLYDGKKFHQAPKLRSDGIVYGPVRISTESNVEEYQLLTSRVLNREFIQDKKIICMIRDPRDILVSSYFSFGKTHSLSKNKDLEKVQLQQRETIQALSLDEYVLNYVDDQQEYFDQCKLLLDSCPNHLLLKYETMILDFEKFYDNLNQFMPLDKKIKNRVVEQTRPKDLEDLTSHRRSGQVAGFKQKLKRQTIEQLNGKLRKALEDFAYPT